MMHCSRDESMKMYKDDLLTETVQNIGAEFVVSFFSGSRSLPLKSSIKSYQLTTFLIQNEY